MITLESLMKEETFLAFIHKIVDEVKRFTSLAFSPSLWFALLSYGYPFFFLI